MTVSWPDSVPPYIANCLRRKFKRPADALHCTDEELAENLNVSISSAREAQLAIAKSLAPQPISGVSHHSVYRRLLTSLISLDSLLGGGFQESWLVELVGEAGAGKAQLLLTISAKALTTDVEVFWLDTENTFRPDRLRDILNGADTALNRIHVRRCASLSDLMDACMDLNLLLTKNMQRSGELPLVVIDSVAAATLSQSSSLIDRNEALHRIARMSKSWNAVTVVTNHLRARMRDAGPATQAALGNTWAHDITCRLVMHLEDKEEKRRWIEVVKAPTICESDNVRIDICITKVGVHDIF